MNENANPLGVLGAGPSPYNLRLVEGAFRNRYPINDKIREMLISGAACIAENAKSNRTRLAAMRVLIAADKVNERREQNDIAETSQERSEQTARLRAALATPEGRAAMAAATAAMMPQQETPAVAELPADVISDDNI